MESVIIEFEKFPSKVKKNTFDNLLNYSIEFGFKIVKVDYKIGLIRFVKNDVSINVYLTTLTVTTELYHYKRGKTQLHRKGLSIFDIKKVFNNPRLHTGKGYYKKKKRKN